jgi:hypothetical protein
MAAGRLDVLLGLNAAEFTSGLTKSEYEAEKFQRNMVKIGSQIGTALGAGFVTAATAAGLLTKSAIDAQDKLLDLSKATSVTVENLGGIGFAASQAGSDLDTAATALGKLNLKIAEAARGEKEASEAFKALGISVKDATGNTKSADKIFAEIATAFEQYADGPEKAALSNAFFSKSYKDMAPLLADGGQALQDNINYFKKFGGVTTETAKAADQFNDTVGKLNVQTKALGNALARELLGPLQAVADGMLNVAENSTFLNDAATLAKDTFVFFVDKVANAAANLRIAGIIIAEFAAKVKTITEGNLPGSTQFDAISTAAREDVNRAIKELDRFKKALQNASSAPVKGIGLESLDAMFKDKPIIGGKPAPRLGGPASSGTKKKDIDENAQAYARYVDQLAQGLDKERQLSKVQEVTRAIEQNRFGTLIPQQKELLLLLAQQADAADEYGERIKHNAEIEREAMRAMQERDDLIDTKTGRRAARQAEKEIQIFGEEFKEGRINFVEYQIATHDYFEGAQKDIKETSSAAEDLGLIFASSIGDFIKNPTSGKTFFQALMEDLLQLTTQLLIIEPLAKSLKAAFAGGGSGSSGGFDFGKMAEIFFGSMTSYDVGTDFVPADGPAMLHRGERVLTAQENKRYMSGGDSSIVINQSFAPGTTRETINQAAAAAARQMSNASRRNN